LVVVSLGSKGTFAARGTKESVFTATNGTNDDGTEYKTRTEGTKERRHLESGKEEWTSEKLLLFETKEK